MALVQGHFGELDHPLLTIIRSFDFLDIDKGPWVGGGALRRIMGGHKPEGDIDIFLPSDDGRLSAHPSMVVQKSLRAREDIAIEERACRDGRRGTTTKIGNDIDFTFAAYSIQSESRTIPIQVIQNRLYNNAGALIADFDFTCVMCATDGRKWIADERFFSANETMTLTMNNADRRRRNGLRLAKYCHYGFDPEPGVLTQIIGLSDPKVETRFIEENGYMRLRDGY